MRFVNSSLAALACAGVLASCGGDEEGPNEKKFDGDEKEVAAVVDDLQAAARDDDPGKICAGIFADRFTKSIERQTRGKCTDRIRRQLVADDATFEVSRMNEVTGKSAAVTVTDQKGNRSVLYFEKQDDDWRIVQIGQ